jgi:predicted Ser/Thr protein kinase
MAEPISDEQLYSWLERDAPELAAHLKSHPEDAVRIDRLRGAAGLARELTAPPFPERVGRFRVVRRLGRGGMGEVFEAQSDDGGRVALKRVAGASDAASATRFARECEALARLSHPDVAKLVEVGSTRSGEPWLAMEFVDGVPLSERMRDATWSRRERLETFVRICDAVAFAHDHGVLHRDLKPTNLLVTRDGAPKVIDFGLARLHDDAAAAARLTRSGAALGTFAYSSPEQWLGLEVDARTDVWSLGVILHEMVTGRLPHFAASPEELARSRRRRGRGVEGEFGAKLDVVLRRALARGDDPRYASVAALAVDLRRTLSGEPLAPPPARTPKQRARRRRRLLVRGAVALLLVAGAAALAFAWWRSAGIDWSRPMKGKGFPRTAPWSGVRWRGETPIVQVDGRWWQLESIEGLRADLLVAFCKQTTKDAWAKRFCEDLDEVLTRMLGHAPGATVSLALVDPDTHESTRMERVAMTEANRRAVWLARYGTPFDRVVVQGDSVHVDLGGTTYDLLAIDGVPIEKDLAAIKAVFREAWVFDVEHDLLQSIERAAGRPAPAEITIDVRRPDGSTATLDHVPVRPWQSSQ